MTDHFARAFAPAQLGTLPLNNRFIKAATFEGKTPDGQPGAALLAFHRAILEGGVAMTTLAYCAPEADGRLHEHMMWMHEGLAGALSEFIAQLHGSAPGARVSAQLVHCGNFSKNRRLQRLRRPLGPSPCFNPMGLPVGLPFAGAMSGSDIDELVACYGRAAGFMKAVGFDAIEMHFGHGYCLSQFISPRSNRRSDAYGGSLGNRMRLPLRALDAVRKAVGDDFPILAKMGLTDGVAGGLKLDEAVEVASMLDRDGVDALICSGGSSSFNPMLLFRGESLARGMIEAERNPLARLGLRLLGPRLFRHYPYKELYFLEGARRVRDRVDCQMVYVGGCTEMDSVETVMREGFDFIQLGRPLIRDPAFVNHARGNRGYRNGCTHCNRCATLIEAPGGVRCTLND